MGNKSESRKSISKNFDYILDSHPLKKKISCLRSDSVGEIWLMVVIAEIKNFKESDETSSFTQVINSVWVVCVWLTISNNAFFVGFNAKESLYV